ncbi:Mitogen-activated protein kinase kinase kinase 20 [Linum grandiflorum]
MAVKSAPENRASSLLIEHFFLQRFSGAPGIIQCYGMGISHEFQIGPPIYNLFLEYAADGSLKAGGRKGIPEWGVKFLTSMLLRAISVIHSRGIIHCDIKPDNVLVFPEELKIADFGLAVEMRKISPTSRDFRGTVRYLPPEMIFPGKVSPAMDIWALGCCVIEMLTGYPPWKDLKVEDDVMREIGKRGRPEIPEWVSEEGKDFLNKCFIKCSEQRYSAELLLQHPFVTGRRISTTAIGPRGRDWNIGREIIPAEEQRSYSLFPTHQAVLVNL